MGAHILVFFFFENQRNKQPETTLIQSYHFKWNSKIRLLLKWILTSIHKTYWVQTAGQDSFDWRTVNHEVWVVFVEVCKLHTPKAFGVKC